MISMKAFSIPLIALTLAAVAGCQPKWVRLDGNSVEQVRLEEARQACRVDRKLAALERAESEKSKNLSQAKTNEAKMLLKDDFDLVERQVYREIDACMRRQGYRKQG